MRIVLIVLIGIVMSGCVIADPDKGLKGGLLEMTPNGGWWSKETDKNEAIRVVNLYWELDPKNLGGWDPTASNAPTDLKIDTKDKISNETRLARAIAGFYSQEYATEPDFAILFTITGETDSAKKTGNANDVQRLRRNRVQDRIILASNDACDVYKRHLLATQSEINFWYGNVATLTASLGAIFSDPATTAALSGASAFVSGSRAEFNSDFFRRLVAEVITRGIGEERDILFKLIKTKQKAKLAEYTIEMALADAVQYNAKCSLIAGLESAQKSQSFYADPGIERLAELLTSDDPGLQQLYQALSDYGIKDEKTENRIDQKKTETALGKGSNG